jgi:hypothetical protein
MRCVAILSIVFFLALGVMARAAESDSKQTD